MDRPLKDFLPAAHFKFLAWIKQFVKVAATDPAAVGLSEPQVAELDQAREELREALMASISAHAMARSATITVREKRDRAEALARQVSRIAQGHPQTTDELRQGLGISVRGGREFPKHPQDPKELVAQLNRFGQVLLKWNRGENRPGTTFIIQIRQGTSGPWQFVAAVTSTRFRDIVRQPGVYINYRVCATRAGKSSLWTPWVPVYAPWSENDRIRRAA